MRTIDTKTARNIIRAVLLRLAPRLIAAGRVARAVGSTPRPSPPCAPGGIPGPATITLDQNNVLQAMLDADGKDRDKQLADVEKVYNGTCARCT